jgi:hypothetical protein
MSLSAVVLVGLPIESSMRVGFVVRWDLDPNVTADLISVDRIEVTSNLFPSE